MKPRSFLAGGLSVALMVSMLSAPSAFSEPAPTLQTSKDTRIGRIELDQGWPLPSIERLR